MTRSRDDYPELTRIIDLIGTQNPLQRKRIENFIGQQDARYWAFAEALSRTLNHSFLKDDHDRAEAARSYNRMCMDILREQIRFKKTGVYLRDDAHAAHAAVYSQPQVMRYYVVGLLLSYLFWPNHYEMLSFFKAHLSEIHIQSYLEIGAGHGLFTAEVMRRFPDLDVTLVDISQTSIDLARDILLTFQLNPTRVRFVHGDYMKVPLESNGFDFLVMGEVLEHVNDAPRFLSRARHVLKPGGTIFLSTCANCPAVDHVYHFHTVDEIRDLIRSASLSIARDLVRPAEAVPQERWLEEMVTINYCAILTKGTRSA